MGDGQREAIVKAFEIGFDNVAYIQKAESQATDTPEDAGLIGLFKTDGIEPPYDPTLLCRIFEHANSLRQNIDAYKTNIDGFGHVFEPLIALREAGARELVKDALFLEKDDKYQRQEIGLIDAMIPPTEDEITAKIEDLRYQMRVEKARAESFFENCVAETSFVSLRRTTREDVETTGNGYWEVIRNGAGQISQFANMPSRSVRVSRTKSNLVEVTQSVRVGTIAHRQETFRRKFKRYLQIGGDKVVYFKEYLDPSIISSDTGKIYDTVDSLDMAEPGVPPANEIIHFKIPSLRTSAYGIPRWIGNLLSVLGSRSAEEVNYAYFENKSIPPMAILVSGGRLGEESVKRIQDFVEVQIKGKRNFHKILVIEAETSAGAIGLSDTAGAMRVEIKQLTDAQLKDGLFLAYDAANLDKVGMGFRLPRLLRGDIRDFNRASAEAALDFAESQVFVPERNDFDFLVNRFILPALNVTLWRFKSNGPRLSDSQAWGDMIVKLTQAGVLVPADAREIASKKVLSAELPVIDADWVRQPLALTIAGIPADNMLDGLIPIAGMQPDASPVPPPGLETGSNLGVQDMPFRATSTPVALLNAAKKRVFEEAKKLVKMRDAFRNIEAQQAVARYAEQRKDEGELVFQMTPEEMATKFGITKT